MKWVQVIVTRSTVSWSQLILHTLLTLLLTTHHKPIVSVFITNKLTLTNTSGDHILIFKFSNSFKNFLVLPSKQHKKFWHGNDSHLESWDDIITSPVSSLQFSWRLLLNHLTMFMFGFSLTSWHTRAGEIQEIFVQTINRGFNCWQSPTQTTLNLNKNIFFS